MAALAGAKPRLDAARNRIVKGAVFRFGFACRAGETTKNACRADADKDSPFIRRVSRQKGGIKRIGIGQGKKCHIGNLWTKNGAVRRKSGVIATHLRKSDAA